MNTDVGAAGTVDAGDVYEVYAVRYASLQGQRGDYFYGPAPDRAAPQEAAFYLWVATSRARTVVVDAGCTEQTARRRGLEYLQSPIATLAHLGVDAGGVEQLVISHLHWDHIGHAQDFAGATITVQAREMAFWTGPYASRSAYARSLEGDDVIHILRRSWSGQGRLVDGDHAVAPGVTVHLVGGHTPGLQVTRVRTRSGHVVLAADASHLYENLDGDRPAANLTSLPDMYAAFDRIRDLADSPSLVVAGHDPLVLGRFPAPEPSLAGLVARID